VRGRNSINSGTQPLYVIDGVPFDNDAVGIRSDEGATTSPLSTINADDIENITVLKDATATSIYGARACQWCYCHHDQAWY
jgi:TonB-dependent SusC/RagA subfamily outer membrane receptor